MAAKLRQKIMQRLRREPRVIMFEELQLLYKQYPEVQKDPQVAFTLGALRQEYQRACTSLDERYLEQELKYFKGQIQEWLNLPNNPK